MDAVDMIVSRAAGVSAAAWVGMTPRAAPGDECVDGVGGCSNPAVPDGGDLPLNAIVVGAVFLGVFVFGIRAIKRQRDDGRRGKLPPIG